MIAGDDYNRRKRLAVIGVSTLLLVAMAVAVTLSIAFSGVEDSGMEDAEDELKGKNQKTSVAASMRAIKSLCQPTYYKQTCEQTLAKSGGNTTDPKELIKIAFKIAEKEIDLAAKKSLTLQKLEKDSRTRGALTSCKELMTMSINELKTAFSEFEDFDISNLDGLMADIKTWLSAAMTYQETCLDAFENTTTTAGEKMKKALKTAMEMSSNGLDIVTEISSVYSGMRIPARRLLQGKLPDEDEIFPSWVDAGQRRLLSSPVSDIEADLVVAKDGSGDFKSIREALLHVPMKKRNKAFVIYIKEGIYKEYLVFKRSMENVTVIGDGADKTRITGDKNFADGIDIYRTATVAVIGNNFMAKNIGFENSAGAIKHQAVALRVSSDFAIFYNCSMDGYHDTLYTHAKRQFYRDCTVSGTIDFVFGDAPVVFQNCTFLVRKPLENQQCTVTAQGRKARRQPSGIIIQNSTITAHPEFEPVKDQFKTYLGRPWKEFSRTVIMESFIDDIIEPEGWSPWFGTFGLKTCWYGEYNNYGPGSSTIKRVKWNGIKPVSRQHAIDFTPGRFLGGDSWIEPTGIPYAAYLTTQN